jgi:hypothetical protein
LDEPEMGIAKIEKRVTPIVFGDLAAEARNCGARTLAASCLSRSNLRLSASSIWAKYFAKSLMTPGIITTLKGEGWGRSLG